MHAPGHRQRLRWTSGLLAFALAGGGIQAASTLEDHFGRDLLPGGLTLFDWEGYMANPAIEFSILPPAGAALPLTVQVTGTGAPAGF